LRACDRNGVAACYHQRFRVGRVEIVGISTLFGRGAPALVLKESRCQFGTR